MSETPEQKIEILKQKYIAHVRRRKINELMATGKLDELNMKYMGETEMVFLLREFTENGNLIGDNTHFIETELEHFINYRDDKKVLCIYNLEEILKKKFGEPELSDDETNKALTAYYDSLQPKSKNVTSIKSNNRPKKYTNFITNKAKNFASRVRRFGTRTGGSMSKKKRRTKRRK
jgi:hypothetical protein